MNNKGQSLVELAISFTLLLFLLSGIVEFGMIFFEYVQLRDAAQEGALYGSICQDAGKVITRARGASENPIDLQTVEALVTNDGTGEKWIRVDMIYHHKVFMPFMNKFIGDYITLDGNVTSTILQVNISCQ